MVSYDFSVLPSQLDCVKQKIRSLNSLRFNHNPIVFKNSVNIKVTGTVEDINELSQYLDKINLTS